jgi:hypothetical protein
MKPVHAAAAALLLLSLAFAGCKAECQAGNLEPTKSETPTQAEPAVKYGLTLCTKAENQKCQDPTDQFKSDVAEIHAVLVTPTVPRQTGKATVAWIAVDTGGAAPPNYKIAAKELDLSATDLKRATHTTVSGSLSRPTKGWPVGKYRVEFEMEGKVVSSGEFQIAN